MLRAGRSIDLRHEVISSNNGIILAPIINIHNLILRSDNKIPEEITKFLLANKIKVNRVKYKGELMVRLMGNFKLSKKIVDNFVNQHKALVDAQKVNLQLVSDAKEIAKEISEKINEAIKKYDPLDPMFQDHKLRSIISKNVAIHTNILSNSCFIIAQEAIDIVALDMKHQGIIKEREKIGLFAELSSNIDGKYTGNQYAHNALLHSGRTMTFSGKNMQLSLDKNIVWGNNPHSDLLNDKQDLKKLKIAKQLRFK